MMIFLFGVLNDEQRALVERIFHEHRAHFQRISFKIVKSEEAAEDVVSTAFVKIMDNIEKISELPCPQMTAFCVTIVKNASIDVLRHSQQSVHLDRWDCVSDENSDDLADECIHNADVRKLTELIDRLNPDDRRFVYLRYAEEMGYKEIGELLNISEDAAKKRGQRLVKKLRNCMREGNTMDMSWQALLQEAAATSFEKTADTLAAAENDNCACVDLREQQIHELSKKILLLPHQGIVLLLSRYCFRLSPEETEMFFHLENAKGCFRFYKELLSSSMGVEAGHMISDDTFGKACHIALKDYLHNELEADADDKAAGNSRTHIAFRKVWKTVAVAAITLTLLFSTCMVANAQFRERVISWVVETFEKYSIFELHGDELDEPQDLTEYQAGYLPDGAILQDTTKQPNTEPGIVLYEYAINEAESFEIMITQSDNRVYFDTENTEIMPLDKDGVTGYFFQKDGVSYICFERDGCFFSVYGSIDTNELVKIAAGITKK